MKSEREAFDALYRLNFTAFVYAAYEALYPGKTIEPNWHIDALGYLLQNMYEKSYSKRLVVNLPPRSLKSFIVSIAFVSWLLGRHPAMRIICASYSEDLSHAFSRDTRRLIETAFYRRIFPRTRLSRKKITEGEFETTRGGFRLATSVGATLTGRGADIMLIDDPQKAQDANSETALQNADNWFRSTASSRLDSLVEGIIVVVQQRLHANDLSGTLLEQGWSSFIAPAIATENAQYEIAPNVFHERKSGDILQESRMTAVDLARMKVALGSRNFAAQYQQDPQPAEGNQIKVTWLKRYAPTGLSQFDRVVLSCDPGGKPGPNNDYTAIVVAGLVGSNVYVLNVVRGHWTVLQMQHQIETCSAAWNVDAVLIEDTATGVGLIQILRERTSLGVIARRPVGSKIERVLRQQAKFEAGRVHLPTEAAWLADYERELLSFPSGKHDDQVDASIQLLEWLVASRAPMAVDIGLPISVGEYREHPFRLRDESWL